MVEAPVAAEVRAIKCMEDSWYWLIIEPVSWSVWHPCSSQFIFKELWSPNNGTRKIILSQYSFILNNYYNKTHQNREANLLICRVLRLIVTNQTMRQWNKFYPLLIKFRIQINTRGLGMVDFCYIELVF